MCVEHKEDSQVLLFCQSIMNKLAFCVIIMARLVVALYQ